MNLKSYKILTDKIQNYNKKTSEFSGTNDKFVNSYLNNNDKNYEEAKINVIRNYELGRKEKKSI